MERVPMYVPTAPKVDRLMERIGGLSNPRDYAAEKVPEGLVDSLPPEGKYILISLQVCSCQYFFTVGPRKETFKSFSLFISHILWDGRS